MFIDMLPGKNTVTYVWELGGVVCVCAVFSSFGVIKVIFCNGKKVGRAQKNS